MTSLAFPFDAPKQPGFDVVAGAFSYTGRLFVRDVVLTRQELEGLMQELLISGEEPRGARRVDDWLLGSAHSLGRSYASELSRHFR